MAKADRIGDSGSVEPWQPVWSEGSYRKWAHNFVKRNLWRVDRQLDFEEAVQECAVVFVRCCRVYEGKVTNGAHFMALFKTAVTNDFNTLAARNRRVVETEIALVEMRSPQDDLDHSNGPLLAALGRASVELREVLRVIANGPMELVQLMLDCRAIDLLSEGEPMPDEAALSRSWCRLARTNVRSDLLSELRRLLID